MAISETNSFNF